MSKKSVSIAGACTLVLVLAAVAVAAAFTQHATVAFTTTKAGKSTGITADIHSTFDRSKPPKAAKLLTLTFPAGTKFNLNRVKACTRSDKQLMGGKSCPSASQIGSGSAVASPYPLPDVNAKVKAFAAGKNRMILLITVTKPVKQVVVIHETTSGAALKVPVPTPKVAGFKVVLIGLKLKVPARGSGSKALITAGRCVAKQFVFNARFVYTDGSKADVKSTSPCS